LITLLCSIYDLVNGDKDQDRASMLGYCRDQGPENFASKEELWTSGATKAWQL